MVTLIDRRIAGESRGLEFLVRHDLIDQSRCEARPLHLSRRCTAGTAWGGVADRLNNFPPHRAHVTRKGRAVSTTLLLWPQSLSLPLRQIPAPGGGRDHLRHLEESHAAHPHVLCRPGQGASSGDTCCHRLTSDAGQRSRHSCVQITPPVAQFGLSQAEKPQNRNRPGISAISRNAQPAADRRSRLCYLDLRLDRQLPRKLLKLLVGVQGLEPWTR